MKYKIVKTLIDILWILVYVFFPAVLSYGYFLATGEKIPKEAIVLLYVAPVVIFIYYKIFL